MHKKTWCIWVVMLLVELFSTSVPAVERHPILLFEGQDIPVIRERVVREPYLSWWTTVKTKGDALLSTPIEGFESEREKIRGARGLAFAFVITGDSVYAAKGTEVIASIRFPPRGGDLGEPHAEAEGAMFAAEAYDLLAGYLTKHPETDGAIRTLLAEEAHRLYGDIKLLGIPLWRTSQKNNWHLRVYSALGVMGIVLNDYSGGRSTPSLWMERARSIVLGTIDYQTDTDGGYAEGPYYLLYGAEFYIPYMLAWRRFSGEDLLNDPTVERLHEWSIKVRMPDGMRPNFDDAHLSLFLGSYLAGALSTGGLFLWDWKNALERYAPDLYAIESICFYDDRYRTLEQPQWRATLFLPEAGNAIFRSDWGRDAVYMILLGEHGKARTAGFSHEHPDAASFIISAFGQVLALDGGYIDFDHHDTVNRAENHNLILVDGQGPPLQRILGVTIGASTDAFIGDTLATNFVDCAGVTASYLGVTVQRKVVFPEKRYFIITDEVESTTGPHEYTWLLHGNGGGTSGGTFTRDGRMVRWRYKDAELLTYIAAPEDVQIEAGEAIHSFGYLQELTHAVLKVKVSGERAGYLTVLYPKRLGETDPEITRLSTNGGNGVLIGRGERFEVGVIRDNESKASVLGLVDRNGVGSVWTDGRFGIVGFGGGEETRFFEMQDGTVIGIDDRAMVETSVPMTIAGQFEEGMIEGYIKGEEGSVTLAVKGRVTDVMFEGRNIPFRRSPGVVRFSVGGEGWFVLRSRPEVQGDFNADGVVDFQDFFLFARAFGTGGGVFDLNGDGVVDFRDFLLFAVYFGKRE